jgi:hypothetical protein
MLHALRLLLALIFSSLRSRRNLILENLVLRQQLAVFAGHASLSAHDGTGSIFLGGAAAVQDAQVQWQCCPDPAEKKTTAPKWPQTGA